jgi:hypothetical protein
LLPPPSEALNAGRVENNENVMDIMQKKKIFIARWPINLLISGPLLKMMAQVSYYTIYFKPKK